MKIDREQAKYRALNLYPFIFYQCRNSSTIYDIYDPQQKHKIFFYFIFFFFLFYCRAPHRSTFRNRKDSHNKNCLQSTTL